MCAAALSLLTVYAACELAKQKNYPSALEKLYQDKRIDIKVLPNQDKIYHVGEGSFKDPLAAWNEVIKLMPFLMSIFIQTKMDKGPDIQPLPGFSPAKPVSPILIPPYLKILFLPP